MTLEETNQVFLPYGLTVRNITEADLETFIPSPADDVESNILTGQPAINNICAVTKRTPLTTFVITGQGGVLAAFGAEPLTGMETHGVVWFVAADEVLEKVPTKARVRMAKAIKSLMFSSANIEVGINYVWLERKSHITLLNYLGAVFMSNLAPLNTVFFELR